MAPLKTAKCRFCRKADVLWLKHDATGRLAPIDAGETPDGNITVNLDTGTYHVLSAKAASTLRAEAQPEMPHLHLNHWVTCPNATQHRKAPPQASLQIGEMVECVNHRSYTDGGGEIIALVDDPRHRVTRFRVRWAGGLHSDELPSRVRRMAKEMVR